MHRLSLLSCFTTFIALSVSQKCYGLDGNALDGTYAPCNLTATYSACCATKRSSGTADICLDNGLCMITTNDDLFGTIWQSGCTDPTGKAAACPNICPDPSSLSRSNGPTVISWNVQMCNYGTYCCRSSSDRRSCCNNPHSPKIITASISSLSNTVSNVSDKSFLAAGPITDSTPVTSIATPPTNSCDKEKQLTAIVGGTLGSVFSAIIIFLCIVTFWMHKQEIRQRKLKEHYESQFSQTNAYRKALASTAGSLRGSVFLDDLKSKSSGHE